MVDSVWFDLDSTFIKLGIQFDAWQDGAGQLILGVDADGKYVATVDGCGLSLPRQVGKTYLIGSLVFALCVRFPGLLVIWTAHHGDTAAETFTSMDAMTQRQKIAPHVRKTFTSDNHKEIIFRNGSRILFGARARGFGRGIPGVDVIVCDEAQILPERAMDDMLATMNTAPNGLAIFMGTPPTPSDPSAAFRRMRAEAMAGESDGLVWIECGADPGSDPDDRDQWDKANPSYPHRTPMTSMLRLRKKLSQESWLREGLGIWDDDNAGTGAIDAVKWSSHRGTLVAPVGPVVLAADTSLDRKLSGLVAVGGDSREVPQVRSVRSGAGSMWVPELVVRVCREHPEVVAIVIDDKKSTEPMAEAVEAALEEAGLNVQIVRTSYPDMAEACAVTYDVIHEGTMRHAGDADLDAAVRAAVKREVEGSFVWSRQKAGPAVVPLVAMSLGLWEWRRRVAASYDVLDSIL